MGQMRKFLIVGCGGSGGATLRYLIDQLRADLRTYGVDELPAAWQFLHIDVNPEPEGTPGLGTVPSLGGRYHSVSSPGNSYSLVANQLEGSLASKGQLRSLVGWAPAPKEAASHVGVTKGAGQYRAVGRMLTLTDLGDLRAGFAAAFERMQSPQAWGELPASSFPGVCDPAASVIPLVVGSMAGGSGASMFLDVCRLLGRVPGLNRTELGVFLFTADVFAALPESARTGVDGNAMGALGEIVSAQTRASDALDRDLYEALGIAPEPTDEPAFARVFPIGSSIGGDGAKFGDGTPEGVFRGLGRALAATMIDAEASSGYAKKVENPNPEETNRSLFGWAADPAVAAWGSFGYASLSLGRERYAEYASQRLARSAVDRLVEGHLSSQSQLPPTDQINALVDAQWATTLARLGLPAVEQDIRQWFTTVAFSEQVARAGAQAAASEALADLDRIGEMQATGWVDNVRARLPLFQPQAAARVSESAYTWASTWAADLEARVREEFLLHVTQLGLPYALATVERLQSRLGPVVDRLRSAPAVPQPLELDPQAATQAAALKKTAITAGHAIADLVSRGLHRSAHRALEGAAARLGGEVLASFAHDVLGGLIAAGAATLQDLESARQASSGEAGLAQLATSAYVEWPLDSDQVPARFDQADNEVLLTTSADFPAQFVADVSRSVTEAPAYEDARDRIVTEIISGRWETTGGLRGDLPVLTVRAGWRPGALPTDPVTGTPMPRSLPSYHLALRPRDLLDRSRLHLQRPDQPFEAFSGQTMEEYLRAEHQPESVREQRIEEFVARFRQTMTLARPLVGVSPAMIQVVHNTGLRYQFSFSAVPITGTTVGRIRAQLEGDRTLDASTVTAFDEALSDQGKQNRIAIFGSYPKYSPLVFSSLLGQIERRWSSAADSSWSDLWQWKRTRPLPGSLAMSAAELRTLIKGWWLGRLLGGVIVPESARSADPVQVFDRARGSWLSFPPRLLTSPLQFKGPDDWLPAVLEAHSLAVVRCNGDVGLTALQPYLALRQLADDSPEYPHGNFAGSNAVVLLSDWLATGAWLGDRPSAVLDPAVVGAPQASTEVRAQAAQQWLSAVAAYIGERYLTDGHGVGSLAVRRPAITSVANLTQAPMFAEIAELALTAVEELTADVDVALTRTGSATTGGADVTRPIL